MPSPTRIGIRLIAVVVAFALSGAQFPLFDCNKLVALSVASGTVTLLLIYATGEVVYRTAASTLPTRSKFFMAAGAVLAGALFFAAAGFFTIMTHICP